MAAMDEEDLESAILKRQISDSGPKSPTILPWDRFSNWLHCACVVTFDLELGQAMEVYMYIYKYTISVDVIVCLVKWCKLFLSLLSGVK